MTSTALKTGETDEQEGAAEGRLFALPAVTLDDSNPTVLKIVLSGHIEIDRANADDVKFYNSLASGKRKDLNLEVHVAGTKTTHRRDSEGNVDAIVQTKSLIVTGATVED